MSNHYGGPVPYPLAEAELNQYVTVVGSEPYYRESITYTIDELQGYLDRARRDLNKLGIETTGEQCVSFLPCISEQDGRLDVLLVPSYFNNQSTNQNGVVKHRFNRKLGQMQGNPGLADPDNLYNNIPEEELEDAYDTGSGTP